ncbi:MAG: GntR family transcriptional regulator [Acidobacteria bacterium]|nr:GntR family transcriptional regulator [Acidobacteriota bacterium]
MPKSILRDDAYRAIREGIISGRFSPGGSLREEWLASELNVSRTPLREALRKLSEAGFVEYSPHRGTRVVQLTPAYIREVFLIREALEGVAAREAARNIDGAGLLSLRETFESLRPGFARQAAESGAADAGDGIHDVVFSLCAGGPLERLRSIYSGQVRWFQRMASAVEGRRLRAFREHESVLSALEARDPEWAECAMRAHIRNTLDSLLLSFSQQMEPPASGKPKRRRPRILTN